MISAKAFDLSLDEFAAFNCGRDYPRMRRWEMPYVLSRLRLPATSAVLDCTSNPFDFGERLRGLYRHAVYRHWNPIRPEGFALPFGVPDGAFDRAVCVNTLEHLVAEQRDALVAEMARKLKPGGLLVLTSDFYFESMRSNREALRMGVVRADGREFFNGWNRVAPTEHADVCRRHGLHEVSADELSAAGEPREDDGSLYMQSPPFEHACVAGVFRKGDAPPSAAAPRRVVLALLTWNTRDISLEALAALAREAATLERLGHEASLVVCDNGSGDGTQEALAAAAGLGVAHRLILNKENRGISVARNQIIEHFVETGGDYLLLSDGDVEVVPFSVFAMLRYMEDSGRALGALGPYPHEHTRERAGATPHLFCVEDSRVEEMAGVVPTWYGLFRREVFEAGVRFDAAGPLGRPGWGFEDNDFAFQVEVEGFSVRVFRGARFLHRDVRSSIPLLRRDGHDPADAFVRRKQYVLDKWAGVPRINEGPLSEVRRAQMPRMPQTPHAPHTPGTA